MVIMNQDQIIQKLVNKAEEIDGEVNIPRLSIIETDLNNFYSQKGKVYRKDNVFYKHTDQGWITFNNQLSEETNTIQELKPITEEYTEYIPEELIIWANELKQYMDDRFEEMKQDQERFFKEIKEFFKELEENMNKG